MAMAELEIIGPAGNAGVRICRMACIEKGILYRFREIGSDSQQALKENMFGSLPALRHGKIRLFEIRGITHYIDHRFNGRALVPADPIRSAEVEQWIGVIHSRLGKLMGAHSTAAAMQCDDTQSCLKILNECIGSRTWLVGRGFTLADMWLLPAVHNFCMHTGHTHLLRDLPAIGIWYDKHKSRKSWKSLCGEECADTKGTNL